MYGDGSSPNFVEHSVVQAPTKKTRLLKAAIIAAAAVVFFLLTYLIITFARATIIVLPMAMVIIVYIAFIFWKYTNVEYDYTIAGGELKMCVVYGGRKRTTLFETRISAADAIVAYNGAVPAEAVGAEKKYKCVSSMNASDIVCMVFTNEDGQKCAVYFEVLKKTKGILKFYNSAAYKIV